MSFQLQKTGQFCFLNLEPRTQSFSTSISKQEENHEHNYQTIFRICQELRKENHLLRTKNKQLTLKLEHIDKYTENTNQNHNMAKVQTLDGDFKAFKKNMIENYKKKVKELQTSLNYLYHCYQEFLTTSDKKYKSTLEKIFKSKDKQNNIIEIKKLNQNYHELECPNFDQLQSNLLRKKVKQLKKIIDYLVTDCRKDMQDLKQDLNGRNDKIISELKKYIKKHMGENKLNVSQTQPMKRKVSLCNPPLPPNLKVQNKTFTTTPKHSTPKNISISVKKSRETSQKKKLKKMI